MMPLNSSDLSVRMYSFTVDLIENQICPKVISQKSDSPSHPVNSIRLFLGSNLLKKSSNSLLSRIMS